MKTKSSAVEPKKRNWRIFIASMFFVLGFSLVFSLVGVLLQSVLANVASTVQVWLGRIGGIIIILFGIYLLGLICIPFLEQEHKLTVKRKFNSMYLTSLVFVNQLSRVANLAFATTFLTSLNLGTVGSGSLNFGIAFLAGFVSFLSPCVLPLIPAFLSYLASVGVQKR